jgi:uncharacterized membrane protein YdjX (TVP38/TMEM64 family)
MSESHVPNPKRVQFALLASVAAMAVVIAIIPSARHAMGNGLALLATGQLLQFQQHLRALGAWGPVVSIALMVAEALLIPVPIAVIMVANGLVFGLWPGMLVSLIGGLLGAIFAYSLGRHFGRAIVQRLLPAPTLEAGERLMAKYGRWAVVVERWIPGIPGDPMSYMAGVMRMPVVPFILLTSIGLVPANLVTAFVGVEAADDIPLRYWIGGWAVVIGGWLIWRRARRSR